MTLTVFGTEHVEEVVEEPAKRKRVGLFDGFLQDITMRKDNILRQDEEAASDLSMFILNRALSMYVDTVLYANEMNRMSHLDKQMAYDFYVHAIRKGKRYGWAKKESDQDLQLVMEYFKYSEQKALDVMRLLTPEDIAQIKKEMDKGGKL